MIYTLLVWIIGEPLLPFLAIVSGIGIVAFMASLADKIDTSEWKKWK